MKSDILIVDDSRVMRIILSRIAGDAGLARTAVATCAEALDLLGRADAIVLIDWHMDGAADLMGTAQRKGLRVLAVVSVDGPTPTTSPWIRKPFRADLLRDKLRELAR